MKIITFNTRDDEIESFTKFSKDLNQNITHLKEEFSPETAHLAEGYEAISNLVEISLNNIYELYSKGSCLNELVT